MSIKVRLLLSYIAMLVVPVVLFALAALIIGLMFIGDFKSVYQIDMKRHNPFKQIMEQQAAVYSDIQLRSSRDPESLLDQNVINELEAQLTRFNMGLVIRKDKQLAVVSPRLNDSPALQILPAYGNHDLNENRENMLNARDRLFFYKQLDFTFKDQSQGSAFIITDINFFEKYAIRYAFALLLALFLILVLTNGLLTYFVSRSIIRPLRSLKLAAEQIGEGNLDDVVHAHSRDEIGELSDAFEQMRRRLKDAVELQLQYEDNRKELLSNISHDLKTPVTSIKGYVEGILDGVAGADKLEKYLQTIYTKTVDMDRMIDELFLFSKLDLGKLPFDFEEVELVPYLEDLIGEAQFDMEKKGVSLMLNVVHADHIGKVKADREKLKRVLTNIWDNAVKYGDKEQTRIEVHLVEQKEDIVLEIADNGQGISSEALPFVFERFYRADLSRSTAAGGSGLGLAIAKQIIWEHGGTIRAESEEGVGTRIIVTLPKLTKTIAFLKVRRETDEKDTDY
ncbi:His Kinase A (phospho-acceptor) domain-containing protein [Paenibacillus sp. 1_12]|uniref:sensor histidine kinase n=1 Tax=Paenibacillus sp. 1_12 TaxID=1566278 RepID=UPI0008E468F2|nr:HAMP domain-containing sensor histidine kinase [Paenibacillus sp. 1_12]SFL31182.1 His Kinase A (phospho-acceptor) domain-containing protein [Paenibacillus sp. 1_12]